MIEVETAHRREPLREMVNCCMANHAEQAQEVHPSTHLPDAGAVIHHEVNLEASCMVNEVRLVNIAVSQSAVAVQVDACMDMHLQAALSHCSLDPPLKDKAAEVRVDDTAVDRAADNAGDKADVEAGKDHLDGGNSAPREACSECHRLQSLAQSVESCRDDSADQLVEWETGKAQMKMVTGRVASRRGRSVQEEMLYPVGRSEEVIPLGCCHSAQVFRWLTV